MRDKVGGGFFKILFYLLGIVVLFGCGGGGGGHGPSYTLSGTINAADFSLVDSDVNDREAAYQSNDDFLTAQEVGTPVSLGGYVNKPNSGMPGRSFLGGDENDVFLVDLLAGQTVTLMTADYDGLSDLDLYICDSNQDVVDASVNGVGDEQLTIGVSGQYYLRVRARTGAANYSLVTNFSGLAQGARLSTASDFAENEVIVKLKNSASELSTLASWGESIGFTVGAKGGADRAMLWQLPKGTEAKAAALQQLGVNSEMAGMGDVTEALKSKLQTLYMIKALQQRADVEYAEPNYTMRAMATQDDQYYSRQWHYPLIKLDSAWDLPMGETEAIVAVVDSGILANHPDLKNRQVASGYDFISNAAISGDGNGLDSNPEDVHDDSSFYAFHGSHVAGTIAAESNNGIGVAGVAGTWPVKLMPLRALAPSGSGSVYDIAQAIYYAAGLENDSGVTLSGSAVASVINLSLGGPDLSTTLDLAIAAARATGVIVVAAAGNSASSIPSYPAASNGVVSVSSVGADKQLAPYSNFGSNIDVAAPGGNSSADYNVDGYSDGVLSTNGKVNNDLDTYTYQYSYLQGTSMAAPHVAGVAALMKTVYPAMTPDLFDAWLAEGALTEDIGAVGVDSKYGHGLIDAYKAVLAAHNALSSGLDPLLYINPSAINFGYLTNSMDIEVSNLGLGDLTVEMPVDDADWLEVTAALVDESGLGRYSVTVNRNLLPNDGNYSATITFSSNVGERNVPVTMQKITSTYSGDAGRIYILAIPSDVNADILDVGVSVLNGQYVYQITGVPTGKYIVVAGSDTDNDNFICGSGESCGGFPLLGNMAEVNVVSNVTGLDFGVSYTQSIDAGMFSRGQKNAADIGYERK